MAAVTVNVQNKAPLKKKVNRRVVRVEAKQAEAINTDIQALSDALTGFNGKTDQEVRDVIRDMNQALRRTMRRQIQILDMLSDITEDLVD
jgi:hypothetical protein